MEFAYHRSLGPIMGVLLGIAVVEMLVVHLVVVALWGWPAAVIAGVFDMSVVIWLVLLIRSFRRLPVTIIDGLLTMRTGNLWTVIVPVEAIAGLRKTWDAAALKQDGVLNLAMSAWPSVIVDLHAPVAGPRSRPVSSIAHKLDDPAAFQRAIMALGPGDAH